MERTATTMSVTILLRRISLDAPHLGTVDTRGQLPRYGSPDFGPFDCPLCSRERLLTGVAFWAHMSAAHSPSDLWRHVCGLQDEGMEEALIRVANSLTHDEAIEIATDALLGKEP